MKKDPGLAMIEKLDDKVDILDIYEVDSKGFPIYEKKVVDTLLSTQEDFKLYMKILGDFKGSETKKIDSISLLKAEFEKIKNPFPKKKQDLPESVGVATMREDGTLIFQLRSEDHGMIAEAMQTYPPNHPKYKKMIDHLGGLKPGQSKSIPPFGD